MKTITFISIFIAATLLTVTPGCKKKDKDKITVRTHTFAINWFRDASTANPEAFVDLYNGKSYNQANASLKADSIDFFIYDRSALLVSSQALSVINMAFYGANNYSAYDTFNTVVGVVPFTNYNASTMSEVAITATEYNDIVNNEDIANLFSTKSLNGGYTDIEIAATDLTATTKYYQFYCAKVNKHGFLRVISTNYLPGGTMTIEVKVER